MNQSKLSSYENDVNALAGGDIAESRKLEEELRKRQMSSYQSAKSLGSRKKSTSPNKSNRLTQQAQQMSQDERNQLVESYQNDLQTAKVLDQKIKEAHAKFGPQSFPLDNEKELKVMFSEIRALKRPHQLLEVIFKALIVELNGPDWASCTW